MSKWIFLCLVCTLPLAGLQAEKNVLAFAGSTREGGFNKKLLLEAAQIAKQMGAHVTLIDLKDYPMPFFNEDLEKQEGMPAEVKEIRKLMIQSQVILIASPEYNGSITGILKNTLDWTTRTEKGESSREAYQGKIFAIMSASPGNGGGARSLAHLRTIIEAIGGKVLADQVVVPDAYHAFDEQGHLTNSKTKGELKNLIQKALEIENRAK